MLTLCAKATNGADQALYDLKLSIALGEYKAAVCFSRDLLDWAQTAADLLD